MSTPKTRVSSAAVVREDLQLLSSAADNFAADLPDVSKTEFWTMVGGVLTNLVTVAVLIGWLDASSASSLTAAAAAIVAASEALIVNGLLIWKYLSGRSELRAQIIDSRYRYMESVAIERMRARAED